MSVQTKLLVDELIERLHDVNDGVVAIRTIQAEDMIFVIDPQVSLLAEEALFLPNGRCNWENITSLLSNGFEVSAGEKHGKRWVVGCILTNKGIITFG